MACCESLGYAGAWLHKQMAAVLPVVSVALLVGVLLSCLTLPCAAAQGRRAAEEMAVFAIEGPAVRTWLERASAAEAGQARAGDVLAASLYCRAARYGSLEAIYRLGRLALAGRGMPRNESMAATLFSIAAGNGHYAATWMVLLTGVREDQLPGCLAETQS